MKLIIIFFIKYITPFAFFAVLIFCISHKPILNQSPIAYNDGSYYFNSLEKDSYINSVYSDDYLGSNLSSTMFLRVIKGNTNIILKKTGLENWVISYIMSFGLLYIVCLFYYFIFRSISKNNLFGYFSGIFVIFNNFTIESIAFGGFFYYSLGLISLAVLISILFKSYERKKILIKDIIILGIFSSIIILPIHLVIYCLCIIFFLIFNYFNPKIEGNKLLLFSGILFVGLHSYWIIPFVMNTVLVSSSDVYGGNASGVLTGYSKMASYINIISFRQYFNVISQQLLTTPLVVLYYIGIIFSVIFIVFFNKTKEYKSILFFFFILYFIFFNISLGPNSYLTGGVFQYLWDRVSVFHFFRSFTRFIIILIPCILVIFAIHIKLVPIKRTYILLGIFITILAHYPLLTGNLKGIVPSLEIPIEYSEINDFLETYKGEPSIIAYPNINYETYSWSISTSEKMRQDYYLKEYFINAPVIYNRASLQLKTKSNSFSKIFSNRIDDNLISYLEESSLNLVLVHKDYINIFNGNIFAHQEFIDYFNENAKILIDNQYYVFYEIANSKDTITLDNGIVDINKISSVEYDVSVILDRDEDILRFYKNFDKNWEFYNSDNEKLEFEHRKHNEVFNKWIINIKQLDREQYIINTDGSYTFNFKLYYKMQDYFIVGKKISFYFLILILVMISYGLIKNRNEK